MNFQGYSRAFSACLILLAASVAVSCSKYISDDLDLRQPKGPVTIDAVAGDWSGSRTVLDDDFSVLWSEGDSFALVSSDNKVSRFTLTSGAGTVKASFSGTFEGAAPYYAVYPYSEDVSVSEGCLAFSLPELQNGTAGNILPGVSPSVAEVPSDGYEISFKNPCSLMCLSLKGSGKVSRISLHDLNGSPLRGRVRIPLSDGKFDFEKGTDVVSGGNSLTVNFPSPVQLNVRTYKKFYFAIPAGSFSRGFSAIFYDTDGNVSSYVQTQTDNTSRRSGIVVFPDASLNSFSESSDVSRRGYYKDLFMDSGIALTSRLELYAAPYIGFSMELFSSSGSRTVTPTDEDYALQKQIICGSEMDENGVLLYPDGAPRFRCVYMNGGSASSHGESLGEEGLGRYRTFNANGGSYVGTCAGAYLGSTANSSNPSNPNYLHLWPGRAVSTKVTVDGKRVSMTDASHRMIMEPGSPLERYFSFPEIMGNVYHNGGCWMDSEDAVVGGVTVPFPKGTEVLMRYYTPGSTPERDSSEIHLQASIWAWKKDASTGRVVLCGSHPEKKSSGVQRDLMGAMLLYATDGCGDPQVKGTLVDGEPRVMDRKWSDGDPSHAAIGDLQYHHFKIQVPQSSGSAVVKLEGGPDAELCLALRKDGPAWISDADYVLFDAVGKTLTIDNLEPGEWYASVYCPTKVQSVNHTSGNVSYYSYLGKTSVLNGVPYTLSLSFAK